MHQTQSKIPNPKSKIVRPGFTFVEVLFAVMILGIGFIMIAGIFPVAINQTQLNGDETVGAALARNGVHYMEQLPYSLLNPPTGPLLYDGQVHAFDGSILPGMVAGNLISVEDPRYAWVPFYRRGVDAFGQPSTSAQVIVVACRSRLKPVYEPNVDLGTNGALSPKRLGRVTFAKNNNVDQPDLITLDSANDAVAPGAFLIVAFDQSSPNTAYPGGANGWVYRIAARVNGSATQYELAPGMDLKATGYAPTLADCYVVGQATDSTNNFAGGAQDVAVYTSFIQLH